MLREDDDDNTCISLLFFTRQARQSRQPRQRAKKAVNNTYDRTHIIIKYTVVPHPTKLQIFNLRGR